MAGPSGQKESKDLPRAKVLSRRWRSRAVTSLAAVMPRIAASTWARLGRERRARITTAISPSYSTCSLSGGSTTGAPGPITVPGDFKKTIGSPGGSLPSSRACSA